MKDITCSFFLPLYFLDSAFFILHFFALTLFKNHALFSIVVIWPRGVCLQVQATPFSSLRDEKGAARWAKLNLSLVSDSQKIKVFGFENIVNISVDGYINPEFFLRS